MKIILEYFPLAITCRQLSSAIAKQPGNARVAVVKTTLLQPSFVQIFMFMLCSPCLHSHCYYFYGNCSYLMAFGGSDLRSNPDCLSCFYKPPPHFARRGHSKVEVYCKSSCLVLISVLPNILDFFCRVPSMSSN